MYKPKKNCSILYFLLPPASLPKDTIWTTFAYSTAPSRIARSTKLFGQILHMHAVGQASPPPVLFVEAAKCSWQKNQHVSLFVQPVMLQKKCLRQNWLNKCIVMPRYNNKIAYWESILLLPHNCFIENQH